LVYFECTVVFVILVHRLLEIVDGGIYCYNYYVQTNNNIIK